MCEFSKSLKSWFDLLIRLLEMCLLDLCDNCLEYSKRFFVEDRPTDDDLPLVVRFSLTGVNTCFFCNDDDVSLINENWPSDFLDILSGTG